MSSSTQGLSMSLPERPRVIYAGEPKDYTLWDSHKGTLRLLYLTQNQALKEVKRQMEADHGFPILPLKQYEAVLLKHFGFSKKISRSDWGPIGYHVEKRVLAGKASHVYLGEKLLPASTVEREVRRYNKKAHIRSRIRQSLSPPLPRNVTIRTPSPQPRHLATISGDHTRSISPISSGTFAFLAGTLEYTVSLDISKVMDMNTRVELINSIRLRSPFTSFVSLLQNLMIPAASTSSQTSATTTDMWNNEHELRYFSFTIPENSTLAPLTSTGQAQSRPPENLDSQGLSRLRHQLQAVHIGGTLTLDLLLQWCFILSNNCQLELPLLKQLLDWVGISAEIPLLESFFSIKSHTVTAVWEELMLSAINLRRHDVFSVLIDVPISIGRTHWIMRYSRQILNFAVEAADVCSAKRLLDLGIPPDPPVAQHEIAPLEIALDHGSYAIAGLLIACGVDVNRQLVRDRYASSDPIFPPIWRLFRQRHGDMESETARMWYTPWRHRRLQCLRLILNAGAKVDIKDHGSWTAKSLRRQTIESENWIQSLGWTISGKPIWFTDFAWSRMDDDYEVTSIFLEHSIRMREHMTMFGIATEARLGLESLKAYLESRPFPVDAHDRIALLEITISKAAANGRLEVVNSLLQFGVDPNGGTLSSFLDHDKHDSWRPVKSALSGRHWDVVHILKAYGANVASVHIIKKALLSHDCDILRSWEISDAEIHAHGEEMLLLFLRFADKTNYQACATMCDFLWSKGVSRDTRGCGDRDVLHYAIYSDCCFEMCKFLISRGYEVHCVPRGRPLVPKIYSRTQRTWIDLPPSTMLQDAVGRRIKRALIPTELEASLKDMQECIDVLVENGACVDSPYHNSTLLETVLGVFPTLTRTPLSTPSMGRLRLSLFEKLLAMGASVDVYPGNDFPEDGRSVIGSLLWLEADDTLMFRVLDATTDVDQHGAPLIIALWQGRIAVVNYLLSRGVKINHRMHGRTTVLHAVASSKDAKRISSALVEHLLLLGAEVNVYAGPFDEKLTPLQLAALHGNINLAGLLMKHGADVNMSDPPKHGPYYQHQRALDYAVQSGSLDMVQLLRDAGGKSSDPGKTGVDGAIRLAEENRNYSISDFLRSSIIHATT